MPPGSLCRGRRGRRGLPGDGLGNGSDNGVHSGVGNDLGNDLGNGVGNREFSTNC